MSFNIQKKKKKNHVNKSLFLRSKEISNIKNDYCVAVAYHFKK